MVLLESSLTILTAASFANLEVEGVSFHNAADIVISTWKNMTICAYTCWGLYCPRQEVGSFGSNCGEDAAYKVDGKDEATQVSLFKSVEYPVFLSDVLAQSLKVAEIFVHTR